MFVLKRTVCFFVFVFLVLSASFLYADSKDFHEIKIGGISVIAVFDSSIDMESSLIKNGNAEEIKKYMPSGKQLCSINAYIIKTAEQTVLVDTGTGSNLAANMQKAGIAPENVDTVLITHGHFDHVSGLIKDGKAVFPKAKIIFSDKEKHLYEDIAIEKVPAEFKQYFIPANQVLKIYGNRIKTFSAGKKITEGIDSVDLNGHTPGHAGFMVTSKGQKLLIAGDFLHIAQIQLPHPEYSLIYDSDADKAAAMRKNILERLVKENIPVAAAHIQFPGIGYISKNTEGFQFSPIK